VEETAAVLIVDDEPRVLDSLEALLAMDYRVLRTLEPKAALSILAETEIAVIVSDQRMPGMTGVELLAQSRKVAPDTVRILLTAFTDADALMASINAANVYRFLLKPWDPNELTHTVRRGVERYELTRERERLLHDLGAKNTELEVALANLRAAQDGLVREASLRAQFERYVSPRLVEAAVANPELLDLPGDWREATVLFADIRGFTGLIERTRPSVVIQLLDEYFKEMVGIIFCHDGTVEQLIGDEIVALFGVHEGEQDAADRAVRAGLAMTGAVRALSERWQVAGLPTFDIGVGLSSGRLMAGTIGSGRRRELIVVGRPMIAAARIQRMTRLFGVHVIASEETFRQVRDRVRYRELGSPKLKGIARRSTLYEILAAEGRVAAEDPR
jgi:class 3 adenylate cyclase/FixJ family two-component response regulator